MREGEENVLFFVFFFVFFVFCILCFFFFFFFFFFFLRSLFFSCRFNRLVEMIRQEFPEIHVRPDVITGKYGNSGSSSDELRQLLPYWDQIVEERAAEDAKRQK